MTDVRLYISVASNRDWKPAFGACLAQLTSELACGLKTPGYKLTQYFLRPITQSSCLPIAKERFIDDLISGDYTHWLSLDDDMTFPMDIVDRLISHGREVVTCNARQKTYDDLYRIHGSTTGLNGKPVDSTGKSGLQELMHMGGAIFLAEVKAFRDIPKPHFQVLWSEHHNNYVGEDVYFSTLMRTKGVKLWCDHDTSQFIGHIGDYEYRFPSIEQHEMHDSNALKAVA